MTTNKELNKFIYEFYKYNNIYRINYEKYNNIYRQYWKEDFEYEIGIINNIDYLLELERQHNNQEEKLRSVIKLYAFHKFNMLKIIDNKIFIEDIQSVIYQYL